MRRILLLLLIALLPLRAWAGDVMALTAMPSPAEAAAVMSVLPPCHGDGAHTAAPLAAAHVAPTDHMAHADGPGEHTSCSSCDICHGSVLGAPVVCSSDHPPRAARRADTGARFASAVLPSQHKPPIA